jgi:hypothetical protein
MSTNAFADARGRPVQFSVIGGQESDVPGPATMLGSLLWTFLCWSEGRPALPQRILTFQNPAQQKIEGYLVYRQPQGRAGLTFTETFR